MKRKRISITLAAAACAAIVSATPAHAQTVAPPARSEYNWDVCKAGTSQCPLRYNPPKWAGRAAERTGQLWNNFRNSIRRAK